MKDRLLALQLGRPPAVHDGDCLIPKPTRVDDSSISGSGASSSVNMSKTEPCIVDYFLAVIAFSEIVGSVLRELYGPRRKNPDVEGLVTDTLDQQLLQWKTGLPRVLRFDRGHTFEKSSIFKRQVSSPHNVFLFHCIRSSTL